MRTRSVDAGHPNAVILTMLADRIDRCLFPAGELTRWRMSATDRPELLETKYLFRRIVTLCE